MYFESYKSFLLSDTLLPDIFISEYMPSMDGNFVKVYLHCLFLSKHNKPISTKEISKKLELDIETVKNALLYFENIGIVTKKVNSSSYILVDLKEMEIKKIYRIKTASSPEDAIQSSKRNKKRNEIIKAINNKFFQGIMTPSWYTDIDTWFDIYKFEEDVMYALFQYCYEHHGLSKNYITRVAEAWHNKKIKNNFDLDNYSIECQKFNDVRGKIVKKLKLNRNLTEYEEEIVRKWVFDYKYSFEIIEYALKKTTGKTNPNFKYIHAIISDWNKNGLADKNQIIANEEIHKKQTAEKTSQTKNNNQIPQHKNFEQRTYDKDFYTQFDEKL
ncbi:MAG: DnaD domain protein [Clostridia bacterium]